MSLPTLTQIDTEIFSTARTLFQRNWRMGEKVRLLGVQVSGLDHEQGQMALIDGDKKKRWQDALSAADKLRDKFGENAVSLGTGLKGRFREKTHEALPEKKEKPS